MTGSSSKILIQDLPSVIRGKTLGFFLYPLSFREYLRFKDSNFHVSENISTKQRGLLYSFLNDYLFWGGFPEVVLSSKEETKRNLLSSYIEMMLFRDIIDRFSVTNIHLVDKLFWKVVRSFTKEIRVNKWFNDFKSQGMKVSKDTLHLYLKYFEDSFFLHLISNLAKGTTASKKAYIVDNGLYNHVKGLTKDVGKCFENQIFTDIKRRGNPDVFYLKTEKWETDFIYNDEAIQACYELNTENRNREISGLQAALRRTHIKKGTILTMEENEQQTRLENTKIYWIWVEELLRKTEENLSTAMY